MDIKPTIVRAIVSGFTSLSRNRILARFLEDIRNLTQELPEPTHCLVPALLSRETQTYTSSDHKAVRV